MESIFSSFQLLRTQEFEGRERERERQERKKEGGRKGGVKERRETEKN